MPSKAPKELKNNKTKSANSLFDLVNADDKNSPWAYIVNVLNGKEKYDANKYQAAKDLLPYCLPRLQSIEAENRNIEMSHEQALAELEAAEAELMGDDDAD